MRIHRVLATLTVALFMYLGSPPPATETPSPRPAARNPSFFTRIRFTSALVFPEGETDVGFAVSFPRVSGSILLRDADGSGTEPVSVRTWSARVRPIEPLAFYAGSISVSGLPARAKNPVTPVSSPAFKPVSASRLPLLRAGTTLDTRAAGFEAGNGRVRVAAVAHASDRYASPCWLSAITHFPSVGPDDTSLSVAAFSGLRRLPASSDDTWFLPDPVLPETWLFLPAAEITLNGRRFQASCSAFASLVPLSENAGTIRADARLRGDRLAIGGRWIRSGRSFRDFSGSEDPIREQIVVTPSLYVPLPRSSALSLELSALAARETLSGDSLNELNRSRFYYGGAIDGDHPRYSISLRAERDESEDTYTAETSLFRFPVRSTRLTARLSAVSPISRNGESSFSEVSGDITLTARPRPSIRVRSSAGFSNDREEGRVDPRWHISVSATPLSSRRIEATIDFELFRDTVNAPLSGSLGIRANLR